MHSELQLQKIERRRRYELKSEDVKKHQQHESSGVDLRIMEMIQVQHFHTGHAVPVHPPEYLAEFELLYVIPLSADVTQILLTYRLYPLLCRFEAVPLRMGLGGYDRTDAMSSLG